jgi:two-component system, OmpR family, phosphate regulon sensor histidine kinase PhoR
VNERQITLATVLIVIGLLGVGVIQAVWLQSAIKSREYEFERKVYESLEEISLGVEELEFRPYIHYLLKQYRYQRGQTIDQDSLALELEDLDFHLMTGDEFDERVREQMIEIQQLMMKEMLSLRPITDALDTAALAQLINNVLLAKGLKTTCHFGITEFADNNFVFVSPGADLLGLFRTGYSIKLFPKSVIDANKSLKLYFPDQQQFLVSSFTWPVVSSIAFFLMIVGAFGLSYRVIFRQKKLSEMKTDFINNMTHELKTPIATISIASEMLKDPGISAIEASRLKYAGIIYEENKRLANHVEQVLQLARLEKGELQLNRTDADIHEIIKGVIHQFDLICEEYDGVIRTDLKASPSIISMDEMHVSNAIKNLIDNAFKYNDKKPDIEVRTANATDGILVYVKDNGIGLSKENQQRVFEKFYRVQGGNLHDTKGFGLGLNYVKSIVEAHDGMITVESKLKEGTTFVLYWPYKS